jgi:hypothetical protein
MGSWVGRDGQGAQAWLSYWLSPRNKIQFVYRNQEAQKAFIGGGHLNNYGLSAELMLRPDIAFSGLFQYEEWRFPVLSTVGQNDFAASVQLTFYPHWGYKK